MKPVETQQEFIRLRAEGRSYDYIAKQLHISKSTCKKWADNLEGSVTALKQEQLQDLFTNYQITKEARIQRLGTTLYEVEKALQSKNLVELPAEKLLEFKLKYTEALKGEYTGKPSNFAFSDKLEPIEIVKALTDLLERVRAGEVTQEQANRESLILSNLLKAYDIVKVKDKLDELEALIMEKKQEG